MTADTLQEREVAGVAAGATWERESAKDCSVGSLSGAGRGEGFPSGEGRGEEPLPAEGRKEQSPAAAILRENSSQGAGRREGSPSASGAHMHEGQATVVARGLRKQFFRKGREAAQHFDAVAACDVDLQAGRLVALKGRSGSGKTTLLTLLGGLLQPTEGSVTVGGQDLYALGDGPLSAFRNQHIGFVPQGFTALHSLSVVQNVTLPYLMYRADDGVESRAMELLGQLGMGGLADSYPSELSGGEARRVAVARALICAPQVVLADEPTSDLDDEHTRIVLDLLRSAADQGAAVLVATHDSAIDPYADQVLTMDAGRLSSSSSVTA